jgi:uncharacterized protein YdeI (YjbR/CyaY-like superfamily)
MDLGETLHVTSRATWREWLSEHYETQDEVWLVYARKETGQTRITYNDAVEVALCYGWIDSNQKGIDDQSFAQRFSRRKPRSALSEMNKQRIRALIASGEMTQAGLDATAAVFDPEAPDELVVAPDIVEALQTDAEAWRNFEALPEPYKRIRVAFIEGARKRPAEFEKRLRHFVKMTSQGKKYGWVKEMVGD